VRKSRRLIHRPPRASGRWASLGNIVARSLPGPANRVRGRLIVAGILLGLALGPHAGAQAPCAPTRADMEGPFYVPGAPRREVTGRGFTIEGVARSAGSCAPLEGARVEWWQANPAGRYDDAHRGSLLTGKGGAYRFETDFPPPYSGRPSHVHFKVFAPGHRTLTTQLYPKAGQTQATFDLVLVKE
jgi:protocatechuate 3,4-dioxygenase beta subunit